MAVNLVPNPSFTTDASGAIVNGNSTVARSTAQFYSTPASLLITSVAAGNWSAAILELNGTTRIAVSPNTQYTFSAWLYSGAGLRAHRIQASERNGAGATTATNNSADGALPAATWTQRSVTFTTTATTVSVLLLLVGTSAAAGGETFYADNIDLSLRDGELTVIGGQPRGNLWAYR